MSSGAPFSGDSSNRRAKDSKKDKKIKIAIRQLQDAFSVLSAQNNFITNEQAAEVMRLIDRYTPLLATLTEKSESVKQKVGAVHKRLVIEEPASKKSLSSPPSSTDIRLKHDENLSLLGSYSADSALPHKQKKRLNLPSSSSSDAATINKKSQLSSPYPAHGIRPRSRSKPLPRTKVVPSVSCSQKHSSHDLSFEGATDLTKPTPSTTATPESVSSTSSPISFPASRDESPCNEPQSSPSRVPAGTSAKEEPLSHSSSYDSAKSKVARRTKIRDPKTRKSLTQANLESVRKELEAISPDALTPRRARIFQAVGDWCSPTEQAPSSPESVLSPRSAKIHSAVQDWYGGSMEQQKSSGSKQKKKR